MIAGVERLIDEMMPAVLDMKYAPNPFLWFIYSFFCCTMPLRISIDKMLLAAARGQAWLLCCVLSCAACSHYCRVAEEFGYIKKVSTRELMIGDVDEVTATFNYEVDFGIFRFYGIPATDGDWIR